MPPTLEQAARAISRIRTQGTPAVIFCGCSLDPIVGAALRELNLPFQGYRASTTRHIGRQTLRLSSVLGGRLSLLLLPVEELGVDFRLMAASEGPVASSALPTAYVALHACKVLPEVPDLWMIADEVKAADWAVTARISRRHGKSVMDVGRLIRTTLHRGAA